MAKADLTIARLYEHSGGPYRPPRASFHDVGEELDRTRRMLLIITGQKEQLEGRCRRNRSACEIRMWTP